MSKTANKPNISKQVLTDIILSWGNSIITTAQLQDWMITHYDPDETDIGLGEPEWTVEAMNIVMNEYEIAKLTKCRLESFQLAIDFIQADESVFNQTRHLFLREGFSD
ncbi:hypothetical protein HQQ94_06465 [Shewanella sp. VB17]|uniref:hypothetical protein n=1 Tax=Shewanella sp. VB17 TaxID=2739432 RepID=UPI001563D805|nr:hypothetical protein [Shewanella sp. VB17]NRD72887.1 hypothetical protein [Shewanella sp. VB17]